MPGVFGGLMRYNEEYDSRFKLKPEHVIAFVIVLALVVLGFKFFAPIAGI
ncbi:preprotein translocase subunit Sec61beta [Candidatus Pacearchaeota archaeon]|nr:preprotein translocase subunit Sec61beta [Candidatus Pacearchaeota archaeon]